MDWDYNIPDLAYKISGRIPVDKWKTYDEDQPVCSLNLWHNYRRNKKYIAGWAEECTNCKQHAATRIYEELTDDKGYFKVIADARVKLEKDTVFALPCTVKEDSRGIPHAGAPSTDASEEQSDSAKTGACGKVKATTDGPHHFGKGMWEASTVAWHRSQFPFWMP